MVKALPVIEDIHRALPDATIDWAVERPCDELLALHPGIDRVVPLELRRYRKERRYGAGLMAALRDIRELRLHRYATSGNCGCIATTWSWTCRAA